MRILPAEPICEFLRCVERTPRAGRQFLRLRSEMRRALRPYRRRTAAHARLAYARGMWQRRTRPGFNVNDLRMTPVAGGAVVALLGSDGAGKSTMAVAIDDWLGWKLQTRRYYLGSKAPSRRSRSIYVLFRMLRRTHRSSTVRFSGRERMTEPIGVARDTVRALHCLSIERDRAHRYRRAMRDARSGRIVIFDRFPIASLGDRQQHSLFDGPQISSLFPAPMGRLRRSLDAIERRLYRQFRLPEHLVMLHVDSEVAVARKPDHVREVLVDKCDAFDALARRASTTDGMHVVCVDANAPSHVVLADIKRAVWDVI
jgi:thymidylate kinase